MYTLSFVKRAQSEYEEAVAWYEEHSEVAADGFIAAVDVALSLIRTYPTRWRRVFKDYYEITLRKYPYNIIYYIDDSDTSVVVHSIFHHRRNPKKKF